MPGQKTGAKLTTHNDNDDPPTVTLYCEECQHEFEAEGHLERTDEDGGLIFIPGVDSIHEAAYCPNDIAFEFGELPVHEISIGGDE